MVLTSNHLRTAVLLLMKLLRLQVKKAHTEDALGLEVARLGTASKQAPIPQSHRELPPGGIMYACLIEDYDEVASNADCNGADGPRHRFCRMSGGNN